MDKSRRVVLAVGALLTCLILLLAGGSFLLVLRNMKRLERNFAFDNLMRAEQLLDMSVEQLERTASDWAFWDNTYSFVQGKHESYVEDNLTHDALANIGVDVMIFLDADGKQVFSRLASETESGKGELPEGLAELLGDDSPLFCHDSVSNAVSGVIILPDYPLMTAARPILRNDESGPPAGTLVLGAYIDEGFVEDLSVRLALDVAVDPLRSGEDALDAEVSVELAAGKDMLRIYDDEHIIAYSPMHHVIGPNAAMLTVMMRRDVSMASRSSMTLFGITFTLELVIGVLILVIFIRHATGWMRADMAREAELRERLNRARRMESLGVLAGGVAHDLNNILGPLVALPELIKEEIQAAHKGPELDEALEDLDVMNYSAKRASTVVRDLLQMSRRGRYSLVDADFNQIMNIAGHRSQVDDLKRHYPDVKINVHEARGSLVVLAEETHIFRAIYNILRNAVESISGSGKVDVSINSKTLVGDYDGYEMVPTGEYAVMTIKDTGQGIDPALVDRIFEPFYTKKEKSERSGSGLGLSLAHGIVKDHGGYVDVQSRLGSGSSFTIYLPLKGHVMPQPDTNFEIADVEGAEAILVADDEPAQRFLLRRMLEKWGYSVEVANNGSQAVEIFRQRHESDDGDYALVLLDMIMEEGFDGLDALQAILDINPDQKALIVSGHAETSRAKEAEALGAHWLAKPYEPKKLGKAIKNTIDS